MSSCNISVDVESDGPCPGKHSMVCFGAVIIEPGFQRSFYGQVKPISDIWIPEALAISGFTREEHLKFAEPYDTMLEFENWITRNIPAGKRPYFWSDNNGYDFAFINYYFHMYLGRNIFGWSSTNIGSMYKGKMQNLYAKFTHLRDSKHTHNPVDDARGNAEAVLKITKDFKQ